MILQPLTAARSDLRRITTIGIPAMDSLLDLRTTVVEWQIFIETNISALAPGADLVVSSVTVLSNSLRLGRDERL